MHHATCSVQLRGDSARSVVAARTDGEASLALDAITACLTHAEARDDEMPVAFWSANGMGGGGCEVRTVAAPGWEDIRATQASAPRAALDRLMRVELPPGGRLVLWHGEPGTGKSYALRALAREWRGWCETYFITDADNFLGGDTSYLLNTLLRREPGEERWRLLVLEDAGELLAADARAVAGQALSRLLNLSDGLLGEGLRAIVLVTTNEPLRRLHPAVVRPGRTWAEVEFSALNVEEANGWLEARDADARVSRDVSLAELFALAGGRGVASRSTVGFAT